MAAFPRLARAGDRIAQSRVVTDALSRPPHTMMRRSANGEMLGVSPAIVSLKQEIHRIAYSDAKVLVTGESGVGKEVVAHALHRQSLRAARPFIAVNCAGLPENLLESELFGHVRGSFTGAYRDRPGKLELADRGTVFLDEIGEMTLRMQGLLLRFLETGEIQKVGADRIDRPVDVRIISATNRQLTDLVERGQFREDLFYRINVIHLVVPPLRERREDVRVLVDHFLNRLNDLPGRTPLRLTPEAMAKLSAYQWPGNIRELQNVIERLMVTARTDVVGPDDLPAEIRNQATSVEACPESRHTVVDDLYRRLVEQNESFWTAVYPLYMNRELTRTHVREIVRKGLIETRGNYRIVTELFNLDSKDYKKFLNFLRKHGCHLSFKEYR
jgi:transcriptional regulator with GAF, ATPase, and Fis domain